MKDRAQSCGTVQRLAFCNLRNVKEVGRLQGDPGLPGGIQELLLMPMGDQAIRAAAIFRVGPAEHSRDMDVSHARDGFVAAALRDDPSRRGLQCGLLFHCRYTCASRKKLSIPQLRQ